MVAKLIARRLSSRWVLQWRSFLRVIANIGISLLLSTGIFLLLRIFGLWFSAAVVACVFACLCFWLLETEPVYLWCKDCKEFINTSKPWRCGYKDRCENRDVALYPFVRKCEKCQNVPTGYRCPNGHLIFFTADEDEVHIATSLDTAELPVPVPPVIVPSEKEKTATTREEQLAELRHELDLERVKTDIRLEKQRGSDKSDDDEVLNTVVTLMNKKLSFDAVEEQVAAEIERVFPGDENKLKRQRRYAILKEVLPIAFEKYGR